MLVCQYEWRFNLHNGHTPISLIIMENKPDPTLYQHQKLLLVVIALTALYTQLAIVMSLPAKPPRERKAHLSDQEMIQLIQFLHKHKSEGGDRSSFKSPTLNAAARHLASLHTADASGDPKTAKQVKNKWDSVGTLNNSNHLLLILISQLKAIFQAIITPHLGPTGITLLEQTLMVLSQRQHGIIISVLQM